MLTLNYKSHIYVPSKSITSSYICISMYMQKKIVMFIAMTEGKNIKYVFAGMINLVQFYFFSSVMKNTPVVDWIVHNNIYTCNYRRNYSVYIVQSLICL